MSVLAGVAIAKGASSIAKWLINRSGQKKFGDTAYAKRLQDRIKHGKYSPEAESRIVGDVSRTAGNIAQRAGAEYRGRLESRGMGRSIAGERGAAEIATKPIEAVTRTRERIATEDEMASEAARDEYAFAKTSYRERLDELKRRNNVELVGGLVDAGAGYATGKMQQSELEANRNLRLDLGKMRYSDNVVVDPAIEKFQTSYGVWDNPSISNYLKTLSPEKANIFLEQLIDAGFTDISGLGF
jgi:hypothetical protein